MKKTIIMLIFGLSLLFCDDKRGTEQYEKRKLTYIFLNQSISQNSCISYFQTELNCVNETLSYDKLCSTDELNKLKAKILPTTEQTDENLDLFFLCWGNCNSQYVKAIDCTINKYATLSSYRTTLRAGTTSDSQKWIYCFQQCNSGTGLSVQKGLSYSSDPFLSN